MNNRMDYLDAVRAFALLLGIVFHASLSFSPMYLGWAVMDISTSPVVLGFMLISHSFRMELFFLIAGFFGHMTFHRYGIGAFSRSRLVRIGIPFVIGWFILRPLIVSGWVMGGESLRGEVDILNGLKAGFQTLGDLPSGLLVGTHLWFLYYLLLITAIVLLVRTVISSHAGLKVTMNRYVDQSVRWIARSRFSWLVAGVPLSICLWFMNGWGMDTPDKSLWPEWPVLLIYGGFFGFGWLLHRQKASLEQATNISWFKAVVCVAGIGGSIALSGYQSGSGPFPVEWYKAGFSFCYAIMMWSLVTLSIGVFRVFFDTPSRIVRYLADASYWLYLIHLPIVVWLQIALAELAWHWSFKLLTISALTIGLSLILYDLFVRSSIVGQTLNGAKKKRVLFTQKEKIPQTPKGQTGDLVKHHARQG